MLSWSLLTGAEPKTKFARLLRNKQTPGEKMLWKKLRNRRFYGLKMRRQVPIGPFIVDFLCAEKRLVIEIDGDSHFEPGAGERDESREAYLRSREFTVLRFGERQVAESLDSVLATIGEALGCFPE